MVDCCRSDRHSPGASAAGIWRVTLKVLGLLCVCVHGHSGCMIGGHLCHAQLTHVQIGVNHSHSPVGSKNEYERKPLKGCAAVWVDRGGEGMGDGGDGRHEHREISRFRAVSRRWGWMGWRYIECHCMRSRSGVGYALVRVKSKMSTG